MNENITQLELDTLAEHKFATAMNITNHAYIDIAGDLVSGTLLSQIMYWFSPDKNGRLRVRVKKDGYYWLAKERSEWYKEIRISIKQYIRAVKVLEEKELIVKAKYKFNGVPMVHLRPNLSVLNDKIRIWKEGVKEEIRVGVLPEVTKGNNPVESTVLIEQEQPNPLETIGSDERAFPEVTKGHFPKVPKVSSRNDERDLLLTEITTELTTESTYINHHQEIEATQKQIQLAKQEVSVTQDQNMVVEVKLDVFNVFGIELSNQEVNRLIKHATKHNKNLSEVIQSTKDHFLLTKKPINDLMASLMHGITNEWDKPKKAKVSKPLPKSIREVDEQQVQNTQPDEDLESTYADIQATMRFLRSTEKQVLHNKE